MGFFLCLQMQGLQEGEKLGVGSLALAGGLAGVCYWLPVYPADIVKSKIQIDDFKNPTYRGSIDCLVKASATYSCMCSRACFMAIKGKLGQAKSLVETLGRFGESQSLYRL